MEEKERCRSRSPARGASRVQQVVGTIIRRTRESLSRYGTGNLAEDSDPVSVNVRRSQNLQIKVALPIIYLETADGISMVSDYGSQCGLISEINLDQYVH